jgi:hypothetical protein
VKPLPGVCASVARCHSTRDTLYAMPPSTRYPEPTQTVSLSQA